MSRPIRGKDRLWRIVKYKGNLSLVAECKCGYKYFCSSTDYEEGKGFTTIPNKLYPYCPWCGARKRRYTDTEKSEKFFTEVGIFY